MSSDFQDSYVRACHDFPGAEQGDLAFRSGDVLYIDRQIDRNWCHGQSLSTGQNGIFPSNFVTRLSLPRLQQSSSQKLFIARDRFIGQQQGDLSFLEGDIVVGLRAIDENWWEGEAGGRRGIFPLTFVVELTPPSSSASFTNGQNTQWSASNGMASPLSVSVSTNSEVRAKVKHDLRPVDPQELELKAGDIVMIEEFVDKFTCRGRTLDGRRGLFGKGFVDIISDQKSNGISGAPSPSRTVIPSVSPSVATLRSVDFSTGLPASNSIFAKPVSPMSSASEKPKVSPKPTRIGVSPKTISPKSVNKHETVAPYGRTKYKFEAEYQGELAFHAGVIVQLIRHVDDEWTEGILDGHRGIFPTSYVDIVVDCPRMQLSSPRLANKSQGQNFGYSQSEQKLQEKADLISSTVGGLPRDSGYTSSGSEPGVMGDSKDGATWMVKYDFMGTEDGDLTAFKGDPVSVIRRVNDEWLEAKHLITGQLGVIPVTYVQSPDVEVKWRQTPLSKDIEIGSRSSTTSVLLDASIAQNISRLENDTVRKEKPHWSPAPSFSSPIVPTPAPIDSQASASAPSSSPWFSSDGSVQAKLQPTVPQQKQQQPRVPVVEQKRSTPPPRPAVPAALKMRQETASQHLEMQRQQAKEQKKKEMRVQRTKVIQEIMATEREYSKDLIFFQETVHSKRNMLDADELLGGSVWRNIIDLSAKLLSLLEEESGKDFVYQEVGSSFLALSEEFKRVYGAFCQSHEESQALLDRYETEPEKQVVLKDMLTKVQQRTTCIDLSTMLSRPVQRVLKYPLFLGELLKCTEDNQSDKVQLMKALKVMTEVAQTMNESKRRKDLVTKYRKDGDATFSERLSRFTLHSVRKKSTRLSMRLSSTIGLTQLAKDDQFEDAERHFRAVDRCCRNLLRDVQSYCEQVVVLYNYQMSIADAVRYGIYNSGGGGGGTGTSPRNTNQSSFSSPAFSQWQTGAASASIDGDRAVSSLQTSAQLSARYLESWSKILLSESLLQKFFDAVNTKVRQPLAHIQHSCKGPEKLVSKRGDKLLDYESVAVKLEKLDGGQAADSTKTAVLEEELRKAKAEYEAMNTQLLTELPQFNRLANEIVTMAIRAFIAAQRTFVYELGRCFEQTVGTVSVAAADGSVLEKFQRKHRLAAESVGRLCFVGDASSFGVVKPAGTLLKRQISGGSTVSRASIVQHKSRPTITFPQKLQTENERCILRNQYAETQLLVVAGGYEARADLELTLKDGDLVGVIVDKDPMGGGERWFVDNGVSKGFVPRNVLRPFVDDYAETKPSAGKTMLELIDLNDAAGKKKLDPVASVVKKFEGGQFSTEKTTVPAALPKQQRKSSVVSVARRESPVIFLPPDKHTTAPNEAGQAEPGRPLRRRTTVVREEFAPAVPPPAPRPCSVIETVERKTSETPVYAQVEKKLVARRPAPAPPKDARPTTGVQEVVHLHPVRPAPRPPPQASSSTALETSGVQTKEQERTSNLEEAEEIEFYVAVYPFTANSENELSLTEGQILAVHDKKDLESNPDWWLVEDEDGALGYVPGNYLTPYTAEKDN